MRKNKFWFVKCILLMVFASSISAKGCEDGEGIDWSPESGWKMHVIGSLDKAMYFYTVDMDGDGDLDVVAAGWAHDEVVNSEVAWFVNNGRSEDWDKIVIQSSTNDPVKSVAGVVAADIDGDGNIDVAGATGGADPAQVYWWKAPSDPTEQNWERHLVYEESGERFYKIYAWDANGDDMVDLVAGGYRAILFENPSQPETGASWEAFPLPEGAGTFICLDDLNDDGAPDVLSSHLSEGIVSWTEVGFENDAFAFDMHLIGEDLESTFDVFPMDINGDGRKDVVVSRIFTPGIKWFESPAEQNGTWIEHIVSETYAGADVYAGDINLNGSTDFVVAGVTMGGGEGLSNVTWFETPDNGVTWVEHRVWTFEIDGPGDISLSDIDGDGDLDIVTPGNTLGRLIWYENTI
jgi:hypothetical protein